MSKLTDLLDEHTAEERFEAVMGLLSALRERLDRDCKSGVLKTLASKQGAEHAYSVVMMLVARERPAHFPEYDDE